MLDFKQNSIFKLKPMNSSQVLPAITDFFIEDERIIAAFSTVRDQLVFTNKRIVTANVQGVRGKKTDYTSIPYKHITTFSIETAGTLDRDCELEVYITAVGNIKFNIQSNFEIVKFNKIISGFLLK
jgi:hypothetical protein